MHDNVFGEISDADTAQKLSNRIKPEVLHKVLDVFARRYTPVADSLALGYTWTIQQIECATDIMFKQPKDLQLLYDEIVRIAIFTVNPDDIATFLRQRITYNCKKEVGTNYNQRILGTRIKHYMGDASIKMYDKLGSVLQIESICNDTGIFRVTRKVNHRDDTSTEQKAPLKKSIYGIYQLFTIMKAANYRYLEFISSFDDHSKGNENLIKISNPIVENERSYWRLNFFTNGDLPVLEVISQGEYMTLGMPVKISENIWEISVALPCPDYSSCSDFMGLLDRWRAPINIFPLPMTKKSLPQDLLLEIVFLYQHWHKSFYHAEMLPFYVKNHF